MKLVHSLVRKAAVAGVLMAGSGMLQATPQSDQGECFDFCGINRRSQCDALGEQAPENWTGNVCSTGYADTWYPGNCTCQDAKCESTVWFCLS